MSPKAIATQALKKGLDIIAVCDHNSAENVGAAIRAGQKLGIHVIPGMEICSKEEVHMLALFKNENDAFRMQEIVYSKLEGTNRPEIFGDQVIVNEYDEVEGFNDRLLIGATQLNIYEIEEAVHSLNGIYIFSHVDRPSYSIISQLGFIPDGLNADGVEISSGTENGFSALIQGYPILYSSDAHFLQDIGRGHTTFRMKHPDLLEIRLALKKEKGRSILM